MTSIPQRLGHEDMEIYPAQNGSQTATASTPARGRARVAGARVESVVRSSVHGQRTRKSVQSRPSRNAAERQTELNKSDLILSGAPCGGVMIEARRRSVAFGSAFSIGRTSVACSTRCTVSCPKRPHRNRHGSNPRERSAWPAFPCCANVRSRSSLRRGRAGSLASIL
jgi:hypothetical protein